jgi:hypothetical protein
MLPTSLLLALDDRTWRDVAIWAKATMIKSKLAHDLHAGM